MSGISFAFDPKKPAGSRVEQQFVRIGDEYVEDGRKYRMATKAYLVGGEKGVRRCRTCPHLPKKIINIFFAGN